MITHKKERVFIDQDQTKTFQEKKSCSFAFKDATVMMKLKVTKTRVTTGVYTIFAKQSLNDPVYEAFAGQE